MAITASILVSLVIGWTTGMWTRKRSSLWCPVDGSELRCVQCASAGAHVLGSQADVARRRTSAVDGKQ
jgi:hypothetical protein